MKRGFDTWNWAVFKKNNKICGRGVYRTGQELEGPCVDLTERLKDLKEMISQIAHEAASEGVNQSEENITRKVERKDSLLCTDNTAASSYLEYWKCT